MNGTSPSRTLGSAVFIGLVGSAMLGFGLFHDSLLGYFTLVEALGLSLAFPFIFFSSTLLYMVVIGSSSINSERDCLYAALAVTVLSFGIDLLYSYFSGLTLGNFATALILFYIFFFGCFVLARIREINR